MPRSPAAIGQTPGSALLQPHEHHLHDRASFETLTSVASSNPAHPSAHLRRPARDSTSSDLPPEHHPAPAASPRPGQVRSKYHFHRNPPNHCNSPPMRALPPLLPPHEALQWRRSSLEADQLLEGSSDDEDEELTLPVGLDLSLGSLYGFPYCMGVPDAMEQRSRAVAEAEEADYQREKAFKEKARLSGRVSSAFKGTLPWTRRSQR
ncbi:hypothetical protein MBLNU13_g01700t2 [Cladosporium sp. NU13]